MESTNYIQKIVDQKVDDIVHRKFIRFSVGDFPREKIIIKKQAKILQIQTGFELAIDLYLLAADLLAKDKNAVIEGKGVVFSTTKGLNSEIESAGFDLKDVKGKKYNVTFSMPADKFREAVVSLSQYIMLLNFYVAGKFAKSKSIDIDITFIIEGAEIPKEYQNDFALARLHAKKKGQIKRVIILDGKVEKDYLIDFCA